MADTVLVACSIFRASLERLRREGGLDLPVDYVDSMGHIHVAKLRRDLDARISFHRDAGRRILLLIGECHATIDRAADRPDLRRVAGLNCYEILLGRPAYHALRRAGAFLLLPEWAARWHEIFREHLGFDDATGRAMLTDMHREIVYLDDGVSPVPEAQLQAFSEYAALPWRSVPLPPEPLAAALSASRAGWDEGRSS